MTSAFTKTGKVRSHLYRRDMLPGKCVQIVHQSRNGLYTLCRKEATFGQTCLGHARIGEMHDFLEGLEAFIMFVLRHDLVQTRPLAERKVVFDGSAFYLLTDPRDEVPANSILNWTSPNRVRFAFFLSHKVAPGRYRLEEFS